MNAQYVIMNGKIIPEADAKIPILTHGFSYGTGCFEGIRGYWNADTQDIYLFRLREHYERLLRSCQILNMKVSFSVNELIAQTVELVQKNGWKENIYIRPMVYKANEGIGVKLHGLDDHYYIIATPMGDYVPTTGLACGVSSWRRLDDNMIPARAKVTGGYVNSALAKTEANLNGFDEAIMLTTEGHVSEGSSENIFLLINGELHTPAQTENILIGITRDTIIKLAQRELGIITHERQIDRTELYTADEILLCGTGAQIAPVVYVDRRPIGSGEIGSFSSELQSLYADVVRGRRSEYLDWLTPAYGSQNKKNRRSVGAAPAIAKK